MADKNQLLLVLDDTAVARQLTASKTDSILNQQGFKLTGFVFRNEHGQIGICECSAVRWFSKEQFWDLMHKN